MATAPFSLLFRLPNSDNSEQTDETQTVGPCATSPTVVRSGSQLLRPPRQLINIYNGSGGVGMFACRAPEADGAHVGAPSRASKVATVLEECTDLR